MKLNLGSGLKRYDGYLNVDQDVEVNPDVVVNLEKENLPFEDNSVDGIIAHHILEHIGDNFLNLIKEIYRVCKDGAIIDIEVPHHRHENFFGDPTHKRPITVPMLQKFSKKYNQWHIETYQSERGIGQVLNVDFEIIDVEHTVDVDYEEMAQKGEYEQIFQLSKRFNNVYNALKVKLMVIKDNE